jgi:hypothetical protein
MALESTAATARRDQRPKQQSQADPFNYSGSPFRGTFCATHLRQLTIRSCRC